MPASNAVSNGFGPGYQLGSVSYGSTESNSTQRAVDWQTGGGASASYTTTAGFGPNFSMSVQYMNISNNGWDSYSSLINTMPLETLVNQSGTGIVNQGTAFGSNVNYVGSSYTMLDPTGSNLLPGSSPVCDWAPVLQQEMAGNAFTPYLVIAGYLDSYGEPQVNARAAALGLGQGYVDSVIKANALNFADGSNYLACSVSPESPITTGYLSSNDSWTETGWSLNESVYVGVGGV